MQAIIETIVFALASILHGIAGMAFPMVSTTALAFFMPLTQVVAFVAIPSLLMNVLVLCTNNKQGLMAELRFYYQEYKLLALTSVIGGMLGVWLLLVLPVGYLYVMMAVVTLYYACHGLLGMMGKAKPLTVPTGKVSMSVFGLLAGAIGGATNAMSPILLIFLFSKSADRHEIAKASNLCYFLSKVVQIYMLRGEYLTYTPSQIGWLAVLTGLSMAGLFVGIWLGKKLSPMWFKGLIFVILLLLSLKVGHTGLSKLLII